MIDISPEMVSLIFWIAFPVVAGLLLTVKLLQIFLPEDHWIARFLERVEWSNGSSGWSSGDSYGSDGCQSGGD